MGRVLNGILDFEVEVIDKWSYRFLSVGGGSVRNWIGKWVPTGEQKQGAGRGGSSWQDLIQKTWEGFYFLDCFHGFVHFAFLQDPGTLAQ